MRPEITLILHNIRSTHNVGAIFRTAEGLGVKRIVISGYTPFPDLTIINQPDPRLPHLVEKITKQIHKTALGAEQMVPFMRYETLEYWLEENERTGNLPIIALEQAPDSTSLPDFIPPKAFALLLGEEVDGILAEHLARCAATVEIPMFGTKESFNVSVACGMALYQMICR